MADMVITKGDVRIEFDIVSILRGLADIADSADSAVGIAATPKPTPVVKVEEVPVPPVKPTVKAEETPKVTRGRKPAAKPVEPEVIADVEASKPAKAEIIGDIDGIPTTVAELKDYFLSHTFDLEKLPELLNTKYGVKGVGLLSDEQVADFYEDLQGIMI